MDKQTSGEGTCEVWEVCPLLRPLLKLEKEKYQNLDSAPLSMLKGQIKAKDIFIDFDHLRPGDFKISNEISI